MFNNNHSNLQSHEHNHSHNHDISKIHKGKLFFVIIFNLVISFAEIIGGAIAGSLSLISDALHNFGDTASLILSYISIKISEKPKNKVKTYGYKRANILSAFINSAILIGISLFLFLEAIKKILNPQFIKGNVVIIVAIIGLLGNLFSVLLLKQGASENINMKSSYLHMLSDTFSSVAVILSGIIIKYFNIYWIDSIFTVLINIIIIKSCYEILKESIDILMQGTPSNINIDKIIKEIKNIERIKDIHHIHLWRLDENNIVLEAHIQIDDMMVSETEKINNKIKYILINEFNISHIVIQFENNPCNDSICKL